MDRELAFAVVRVLELSWIGFWNSAMDLDMEFSLCRLRPSRLGLRRGGEAWSIVWIGAG
jgi:hypothetical protein